MFFELFVEDSKIDFVNAKRAIVQQRLQTNLLLLIQELEADQLRREKVAGRGISGDASVETFEKAEAAKRWHDETFAHDAELIKQIERNRTLGSMVLPKEH
jgi:hypothetical protein